MDNNKKIIGRGWNKSVLTYNEATRVSIMANCFAIMFTNVGDTTAFLDGMVIFPSVTPLTALGDSRTISGHILDVYVGSAMALAFAQPLGANPSVEIVQLFYTTEVALKSE